MKNQIKEVQDYFKKKLLSGDFEIVKFNNLTATISIDAECEFEFWATNSFSAKANAQYQRQFNFMDLQITEEEIVVVHCILMPIVLKNKRDVTLAEKRAELKSLENELEKIQNSQL